MAQTRSGIEAWPLLPRPAARGDRPADDPARAALEAMVGLAATFLALRLLLPDSGLASELARLIAFWGGLGGLGMVSGILLLVAAMPLAMPMLQGASSLTEAALVAFDHAVHLALVISCAGMLAVIILHGEVRMPAMWFAGQAAVLWACHRTRLWLSARHGG